MNGWKMFSLPRGSRVAPRNGKRTVGGRPSFHRTDTTAPRDLGAWRSRETDNARRPGPFHGRRREHQIISGRHPIRRHVLRRQAKNAASPAFPAGSTSRKIQSLRSCASTERHNQSDRFDHTSLMQCQGTCPGMRHCHADVPVEGETDGQDRGGEDAQSDRQSRATQRRENQSGGR